MYIDREGHEIQRYKAKTQVTEKNETKEDSEHKVFTKITLVHQSNSFANSNDIQKMIYNILEYAQIEFDYNLIFDGSTNKTESKPKWKKFKDKLVKWINLIYILNYILLILENKIFNANSIKLSLGRLIHTDWSKYFKTCNSMLFLDYA